MADFKYIMQGFSENVNFLDAISEVLEDKNYSSIYVLSAYANEKAIYNLEKSIKKSESNISFIIGIRNGSTTVQALKRLFDLKVSVITFDTARIDSIFHAKTVLAYGSKIAKLICGSANMTTGGLANNIEAGIVVDLQLDNEEDSQLFNEAKKYIEAIINDYPENVRQVKKKTDLDLLKDNGLLADESMIRPRYSHIRKQDSDKETIVVSRFPLHTKKLGSIIRRKKQVDAIIRAVEHVTVEEHCEEVWKSKPLKSANLGISRRDNTHPKGEMGFGKGKYLQIDSATYFRNDIFGKLNWKENKKGDEEAVADFMVIICGIHYGEHRLTLLHKRKGMVAYNQANYVTSIRWGSIFNLVRNSELIGRELTILRSIEKNYFILNIE